MIFALHTPTAVLDYNQDGIDESLAQSENFYNLVGRRIGADLLSPMPVHSDAVPGHWTAYATPRSGERSQGWGVGKRSLRSEGTQRPNVWGVAVAEGMRWARHHIDGVADPGLQKRRNGHPADLAKNIHQSTRSFSRSTRCSFGSYAWPKKPKMYSNSPSPVCTKRPFMAQWWVLKAFPS